MLFDVSATFLVLLFWAAINYFAAKVAKKKFKRLDVHPWYYVIGSLIFGGIFPLIFLAGKVILYKMD